MSGKPQRSGKPFVIAGLVAAFALAALSAVYIFAPSNTSPTGAPAATLSSVPPAASSPASPAPRPPASTRSGGQGVGQYRIEINGADITAEGRRGTVSCEHRGDPETGMETVIRIEVGASPSAEAVVSPYGVVRVTLRRATRGVLETLMWRSTQGDEQQGADGPNGDPELKQNGNTYTITGDISPVSDGVSPFPADSAVPFEFEATCPQ
jgi:hypothetical protein